MDLNKETETNTNNFLEAGLNLHEEYILKLAKGSTLVRHSGVNSFYRYWFEHPDGRVMTEVHYSTLVKLRGGFFNKYFSVVIPTNSQCRQYYKLKQGN